jgi:hypothetical protein
MNPDTHQKNSTLATQYELSLYAPSCIYYDYDYLRNDYVLRPHPVLPVIMQLPFRPICARSFLSERFRGSSSPEVIPGDR